MGFGNRSSAGIRLSEQTGRDEGSEAGRCSEGPSGSVHRRATTAGISFRNGPARQASPRCGWPVCNLPLRSGSHPSKHAGSNLCCRPDDAGDIRKLKGWACRTPDRRRPFPQRPGSGSVPRLFQSDSLPHSTSTAPHNPTRMPSSLKVFKVMAAALKTRADLIRPDRSA